MSLKIEDRIVLKHVVPGTKYTRVRYEFWCECGCDKKTGMNIYYHKGTNLTEKQLKAKLIQELTQKDES